MAELAWRLTLVEVTIKLRTVGFHHQASPSHFGSLIITITLPLFAGENWLLGRGNLVVGRRGRKSTTSYQDRKVKKQLFIAFRMMREP